MLDGIIKRPAGKARLQIAFPREYRAWSGMNWRCTNPNCGEFHNYGGRGIRVCSKWMNSATEFIKDMGEVPPGFELDRIDNNGGYSPENCRWTDHRTNCRNQRVSVSMTVRGVTKLVIEWAEEMHMPYATIYGRLWRGLSPEESLTIGSTNKPKTHCPKGHPYAGDNLIRSGHKECRICTNARRRAKRANK